MSLRWVMTYLPDRLKERPGVGGPSKTFFENVKRFFIKVKLQGLQLNCSWSFLWLSLRRGF